MTTLPLYPWEDPYITFVTQMTPRLEKAAGAYQMELNAEKRRDSEHQTP